MDAQDGGLIEHLKTAPKQVYLSLGGHLGGQLGGQFLQSVKTKKRH